MTPLIDYRPSWNGAGVPRVTKWHGTIRHRRHTIQPLVDLKGKTIKRAVVAKDTADADHMVTLYFTDGTRLDIYHNMMAGTAIPTLTAALLLQYKGEDE